MNQFPNQSHRIAESKYFTTLELQWNRFNHNIPYMKWIIHIKLRSFVQQSFIIITIFNLWMRQYQPFYMLYIVLTWCSCCPLSMMCKVHIVNGRFKIHWWSFNPNRRLYSHIETCYNQSFVSNVVFYTIYHLHRTIIVH